MAFHETFWVAAAAAAPIIALANQVTLTESRGMTGTFIRAQRANPSGTAHTTAITGHRSVLAALSIGYLNLIAQVFVLYVALGSLYSGEDSNGTGSPRAVIFLEICGLAAVGLAAVFSGVVRSARTMLDTEGRHNDDAE